MNKIFTIALIILFALLLCSCTKNTLEETVKPTIVSNVETLENLKPTIIYYGKTDQNYVNDNIVNNFNQLLYSNHGLLFKLEYVDTTYTPYYIALQDAPYGGIYYLRNSKYYNLNKAQALFHNINTYLIDNLVDDEQYNEILKHLTTSNNETYVLPLNPRISYYHRGFSNNALSIFKRDTPVTLQELTSLAEIVANSDYNKNGIKDEYILAVSYNRILIDLRDIFAAYGCYINDQSESLNISYNPLIESFEDITQTKPFKEAMTYIRYLQDEELILISDTDINNFSIHNISNTSEPFLLSAMYKDTISYTDETKNNSYYLEHHDYQSVVYKEYDYTGFMFLNDSNDNDGIEENIKIITNDIFRNSDLIKLFKSFGLNSDNHEYMLRTPRISIKYFGAPFSEITLSPLNTTFYHTSDFVFHDVPYQYENQINEAFSNFITNYMILHKDYDDSLAIYNRIISSIDIKNYIHMLNSYKKETK